MPQKKIAVDGKTIQTLDKLAIRGIGISSLVLMENAGRSVAQEAIRWLKKYEITKYQPPRVCIFCGRGNNAGDGLVAARYLVEAGVFAQVFLVGQYRDLKADAALNYQILKNLQGSVFEIDTVHPYVFKVLQKSQMVIDAIFGVGLNRQIRQPFKNIIEVINTQKKPIMAVDVPSGLDATTGRIFGACVRATATVTFTLAKKGFFKNEGPRHAGKIIVADIGIPRKLFERLLR